MTVDPRAALDRLLAALEAHYHAVATRRTDDDPKVDDAYDVLADAFEAYDDAMARVHGETLPFYLADDEADDDGDGDDEDDLADDEDELDLDDDVLAEDELTDADDDADESDDDDEDVEDDEDDEDEDDEDEGDADR